MPAPALRLSDRQLKAVKAKDKDYVLSDGDGLQLRVRSNGSMLWNFNYREPVTKNRINMGLGTYPELSLANARKKVVEARELLAQGIDPKVQRSAQVEAKRAETEHTFENVATAWFELKKDSVTPAYAEDIWRSLTLHVFPDLKTTPLSKITAPMVIELLRPIEAKGSLETVKRLSQRLNEIMTYGVNSGLIFANPPQWHSGGIQETKKRKHGRATTRRAVRAHDRNRERQHQADHPLPDRMATAHHDPSCRSGYHPMGRHRLRQTHLDHPAGAHEKASSAHHPADRTGTCVTGGAQAPQRPQGIRVPGR